MVTPKEKSQYGMFGNTWFLIRLAWSSGEKKVPVLSLLSAFFAVALNLINLYISPAILAEVERRSSVRDLLFTIGAFVSALMLVSAASAYVEANAPFGRITLRAEINNLLTQKAATTSYPNVFNTHFISLIAKTQEMLGTNGAAAEIIWQTLSDLLTNLTGFCFYVALMSSVQPLLLIVILSTALISHFVSNHLSEWRYRHREEEAEYAAQLSYLDRCSRDLTAAKDIRIFGLRTWLEELYDKSMDTYIAFHSRVQNVYLGARVLDLVLTFLRSALAYAYLISLVIGAQISTTEFLLYFSAAGGFSTWISGILNGFHELHKQSMEISAIRECLEYPEPFCFENGTPVRAEAGKSYELRLEHVSFRYPGADKDIISDLSLTLHPGEKLAVVGQNGAGKTTLIKLICGFLDPTSGRVLLNNQDIRTFNRRDYYTLFSAVFQTFSLLAGSIAVNIAQSVDDIDMARVRKAAALAGLNRKICALKDGYETLLNREVYENAISLSGGELQRLMLARALYKNAPFLMLDEPTAALDPVAESEIYQTYHEMSSGKSSIYISHRLASTRFCDRIILLEDGRIAEEGTHGELIRLHGKYAGLYEIQSQYYKGGDHNERTETDNELETDSPA